MNLYPPQQSQTLMNLSTFRQKDPYIMLDRMDMIEAKKYDKRSFSNLFVYRVKQFHPIYISFFSHSLTTIKFIEISNFFFNISSNLAFNALFCTDKYISNTYYNGYSLGYQIPKSIFSLLSGLIITLLCQLVKVNFVTRETVDQANRKNFKREFRMKIIQKMKLMNKIYFIILFSFSFFFWYFVTAFCSVYKNNQFSWVIGALVSIVISLLIPVLLAFMNVLLRRISLNYQISNLFYLSRLMESYR